MDGKRLIGYENPSRPSNFSGFHISCKAAQMFWVRINDEEKIERALHEADPNTLLKT